jgi:hypothetical protein
MDKSKGHKYVNHKALHIGGVSNSYFIGYTNKSDEYRCVIYKSDNLELAFRNFKDKYPNRTIVEIRESNY